MPDTIFALATATARAALAVVRLSGPEAGTALSALTARPLPTPRRAAVRTLTDGAGVLLDEALVLWMPAPASFTGEDTVELQLHGGRAVTEGVLATLLALKLRPAAPGEFTRRAFEHGRLDLTRAEAVADLVDAETGAQRAQALAQLGGALDRRYARWRDMLVEVLARLEAAVDFPDEDVPDTVLAEARQRLSPLLAQLRDAADDRRGRAVRDGFRIALLGPPNAGKSSLLNALAERDAAIVTPIAGTTRDVIEVVLDLDGRRVLLSDTAGLTETADAVEQEGVRRAVAAAQDADLRLWLIAPDLHSIAPPAGPDDLHVATKSDLGETTSASAWATISVASGAGIVDLRRRLASLVGERLTGAEFPPITRQRHAVALTLAIDHLKRAYDAAEPELQAEDVRLAARALASITGQIGAEDVLDRVFSSFCIGK